MAEKPYKIFEVIFEDSPEKTKDFPEGISEEDKKAKICEKLKMDIDERFKLFFKAPAGQ